MLLTPIRCSKPLLAAAAANEPLEPIMEAIVRRFGFESFMYAMTTDPTTPP